MLLFIIISSIWRTIKRRRITKRVSKLSAGSSNWGSRGGAPPPGSLQQQQQQQPYYWYGSPEQQQEQQQRQPLAQYHQQQQQQQAGFPAHNIPPIPPPYQERPSVRYM